MLHFTVRLSCNFFARRCELLSRRLLRQNVDVSELSSFSYRLLMLRQWVVIWDAKQQCMLHSVCISNSAVAL